MTEQDRKVFKEMLKEAIEHHSEKVAETLKGEFKVIDVKLDAIKSDTDLKLDAIKSDTAKTNGKVAEQERAIHQLREANSKHTINCPQTKEIAEINKKITTLEKMEVSRDAISKFTWKQVTLGGIIAGLIISLTQLLLK